MSSGEIGGRYFEARDRLVRRRNVLAGTSVVAGVIALANWFEIVKFPGLASVIAGVACLGAGYQALDITVQISPPRIEQAEL